MGRAFENQRQSQLLTFAAEHSCSSCPAATVRGGLRVRTRNREVPASPADQKLPCLLPSPQNRVSGWNTLVSSFSQLHRGLFTHLRPQAQGSGPQSPPSCPLSARVPARPGPPGSQQAPSPSISSCLSPAPSYRHQNPSPVGHSTPEGPSYSLQLPVEDPARPRLPRNSRPASRQPRKGSTSTSVSTPKAIIVLTFPQCLTQDHATHWALPPAGDAVDRGCFRQAGICS